MSSLVLRVQEVRLKRGYTQAELARRAGVRRATINSLESRHVQRINMGVLEKIAKALEVPTLRLLREE
jgi:transcriptional regulator with XRE-family HTH domain